HRRLHCGFVDPDDAQTRLARLRGELRAHPQIADGDESISCVDDGQPSAPPRQDIRLLKPLLERAPMRVARSLQRLSSPAERDAQRARQARGRNTAADRRLESKLTETRRQ